MDLIGLFHAMTEFAIRPANVGGQLELRGASIPQAIRDAALAHKAELLPMLPDAEREAIRNEPTGPAAAVAVAQAVEEWNEVVARDLVQPVLDKLKGGFHKDPPMRQRQFDQAFAIDTAWIERDMGKLRAEVGQFVGPNDLHWRHFAED